MLVVGVVSFPLKEFTIPLYVAISCNVVVVVVFTIVVGGLSAVTVIHMHVGVCVVFVIFPKVEVILNKT
jgi:hypothetical protein